MALKRHSKFNSAPALVDVDGVHLLMSRCKVHLLWREKEKAHSVWNILPDYLHREMHASRWREGMVYVLLPKFLRVLKTQALWSLLPHVQMDSEVLGAACMRNGKNLWLPLRPESLSRNKQAKGWEKGVNVPIAERGKWMYWEVK